MPNFNVQKIGQFVNLKSNMKSSLKRKGKAKAFAQYSVTELCRYIETDMWDTISGMQFYNS